MNRDPVMDAQMIQQALADKRFFSAPSDQDVAALRMENAKLRAELARARAEIRATLLGYCARCKLVICATCPHCRAPVEPEGLRDGA